MGVGVAGMGVGVPGEGWSTRGGFEYQGMVGVPGEGFEYQRGARSTRDGARRVTMFVKVHHEGPRIRFSNPYSTGSHSTLTKCSRQDEHAQQAETVTPPAANVSCIT